MHIPCLLKSRINLNLIRDEMVSLFKERICSIGGLGISNKTLVFESSFTSFLSLMIKSSVLKSYGIMSFHVLEEEPISNPQDHIIYIIKPKLSLCQLIISHINKLGALSKQFHIAFISRITIECERSFEHAGLWGKINFLQLPISLIPIDYDLLSFEDCEILNSVIINHNYLPLINYASALISFEKKFGIIPVIQCIGNQSSFVAQQLLNIKSEYIDSEHIKSEHIKPEHIKPEHIKSERIDSANIKSERIDSEHIKSENNKSEHNIGGNDNGNDDEVIPSQIDRMIIIDRESDYMTPLLTQRTYSGLIDEIFNIEANIINVSPSIFPNKNKSAKKLSDGSDLKPLGICSNDAVYELLRDDDINCVGSIINDKLTHLKNAYAQLDINKRLSSENGLTLEEKLTRESELFTIYNKLLNEEKQMPELLLTLHLNITENIIETLNQPKSSKILDIEENLLLGIKHSECKEWLFDIQGKTVLQLLRILSIYCFVNDGIDMKICNKLRELLEDDHYRDVYTIFQRLFQYGILYPQLDQYKGFWNQMKENFCLLKNSSDEVGYSPLSCRLIETLISIPIKRYAKEKKDCVIPGIKRLSKKLSPLSTSHLVQQCQFDFENLNSTIIIFYIGGITYSEIASIRYLTKLNPGKHIIIMTTKIINGNSLIKSLL